MKEHRTTNNASLSPHNAAETAQVTPYTPPVKEAPGEARLPYVAPAIEVIEVRTERGYAASGGSRNDPWSPATW